MRGGKRGFWSVPGLPGLTAGEIAPDAGAPGAFAVRQEDGALCVETPFYKACLCPDGSFASLEDRELDREWVKAGCGFNKLHVWADNPGMYDAWDILPNYRDVAVPLTVAEPLAVAACTDQRLELACVLSTGASSWRMVIRFFASARAIEVEHIVDWHEKHRLAKINYGPDVLTRELVCDTSAGAIRRSLTKNTSWEQARFEVCHHKWFDMSEGGAGFAVVNEGKYGLGLEGDEVSLSLLRSTIRPDITSDMGHHDICTVLLPHAGDAAQAGVNRYALEVNVPLRRADLACPAALRDALDECGLYLQAVKLGEDGDKVILRLSEQDGRRGTLRLPFPVKLLNMLEDEEGEADAVPYTPYEILTLGVDPALIR